MKALFFALMISSCIAGPVIEEEDRKILRPFFRMLLTQETVGYVLLGDKPAALIGYLDHLSWKHPIDSLAGWTSYYRKGNQREKKSWQVWKKYSSGISQKFLILEEMSASCPHANDILVINCELFCKVVNENRDDFEKVLERTVTGEQLLEEAKRWPLRSVLLKGNEALLGIILGFGKNNSWRFAKRENMKKFGLFPKKEDQTGKVRLPIFRADWEDPETHQLRDRYVKCREKIQTTFLDRDPLDEVINILFEQQSQAHPSAEE